MLRIPNFKIGLKCQCYACNITDDINNTTRFLGVCEISKEDDFTRRVKMSRIRFWQGSRGSKTALALRLLLKERGMNVLRIKAENSRYKARVGDIIINWGSSDPIFDDTPAILLNSGYSVSLAANKKLFFKTLERAGVREIPICLYNYDDACEYIESLDYPSALYCRTKLTGNSGEGIVVAREAGEVVEAALYTEIIPNILREVRVHVFKGSVISYSQKKRMNRERIEDEGITLNEEVRNLNGGFIFAREGVSISQEIQDKCIEVAEILHLSFCAFDIIEDTNGSFYFLEANTAPGLQGTTLIEYSDAIYNLI